MLIRWRQRGGRDGKLSPRLRQSSTRSWMRWPRWGSSISTAVTPEKVCTPCTITKRKRRLEPCIQRNLNISGLLRRGGHLAHEPAQRRERLSRRTQPAPGDETAPCRSHSMLIDIGRISELKTISVSGNTLSIGALCTHDDIATSADVRHIVRRWLRRAATSGIRRCVTGDAGRQPCPCRSRLGSTTVVLACNAIIHVRGPNGARTITADDFFTDLFATDLQPGELITQIYHTEPEGLQERLRENGAPASSTRWSEYCSYWR